MRFSISNFEIYYDEPSENFQAICNHGTFYYANWYKKVGALNELKKSVFLILFEIIHTK